MSPGKNPGGVRAEDLVLDLGRQLRVMVFGGNRSPFIRWVIQHAFWLYLRFTLSYRDAEDLLAESGLDISYETVRRPGAKVRTGDGAAVTAAPSPAERPLPDPAGPVKRPFRLSMRPHAGALTRARVHFDRGRVCG
jgi:hypothetical protein